LSVQDRKIHAARIL